MLKQTPYYDVCCHNIIMNNNIMMSAVRILFDLNLNLMDGLEFRW